MTNNRIEVGDVVSVNFHNIQFTLCFRAKVEYVPCSMCDGWIFRDVNTNEIHYVSEGCTITKIQED